jgi:uncharacterized protein (TIGR02118 family)
MRISSWLLCSAFALATACGKSGDRAAEARGGDTTVVSAPSPGGPMAIVTVLYNAPKDTAAFERYYAVTHLPLLRANQNEIGFVRADFTRFVSTADGKKPTYYRQAELYFNSMDDLKKGTGTPGFKKVADDLGNFATGGLTGMIARASNPHEEGSTDDPAAIVTVIYKTPKDTTAFEKYYAEKHLPLVVAAQEQIGFDRAEFTKFEANLDGSKRHRYRQAVLYFSSMDDLKKGTVTTAFKEVAGDLPKFATGGFDALVGAETK